MPRYYAIATVIVLAIAIVATAWTSRDLLRDRIAATNVRASPNAQGDMTQRGGGDVPISGDAPWALSALPDCATQTSFARGPIPFVRSKLPRGAVAIPAGTTVPLGACTILVGDGEIRIQRGLDHLRIPPLATLYRTDKGFALLRRSGKTAELRVYERSTNR